MDSGCSIDIVPSGHAPNVRLRPRPKHRPGRVINAANGTRIKEHGMKKLKFRMKFGQKLTWNMVAADVKKALKSVAVTCDGVETSECHVLSPRMAAASST